MSTYVDSVEENGDDVASLDALPVLRALIIAPVTQLAVVEGPAVLGVAESLEKKQGQLAISCAASMMMSSL